ncbi:MAG: sigma-70 family RNA polymerase sigma factor [Clostridia bacterium]|nr:sigma-70 family RNA polymerase sigma factor [Clostridia bacterium]
MYDNARNIELVRRAKAGDAAALDTLMRENAGLIRSVAGRFCGRGQDTEDLIQIGSIGMMKAVRGFDEEFGTAFSTYAVHMVAGELRRFLRDDGLIKVSRDIKRRGYLLFRAGKDFAARNGREPRISELCEMCSMSHEEVVTSLEAMAPAVSLQEKTGDDDSASLEELIGEDNSEEITNRLALAEAIKKLPQEDRILIYLRYYRGLTQCESARRLGLTQVKVSRREKKIIERLRGEMIV